MSQFTFQNTDKLKQLVQAQDGKIAFVKDHGVYLMDDGPGKATVVIFAQGLNPDINTDWYHKAREKCGGDDMAETIKLSPKFVNAIITNQVSKLRVTLSKTRIQFTATR